MNDRITIFDTTLRDGEQAPGASMTIPEKLKVAHQLAALGVDVVEAGFPISSPAQREAVERIAAEVRGPVVCALARTVEADVEAAGEAIADAARGRIHTFVATSDVHLKAKFGADRFGRTLDEKRATVLQMTRDAVRQARTYTDDVEFSAEDAGRTDHDFLCQVIRAAVDAGATTINIPDTTGYCTPGEYAALFEKARTCVEDPNRIVFSTHCHDDLGLAVANSLAAVRAGARQIECTINGIGERAGNAALEEVVMALRVRGDRYGVTTGIDAPRLTETSRLVAVYSGFPVQPNKAVVGRNAFSHEAGIHQHGVLKERSTYEIMRAEDVGQDADQQIRLGRHSGRHGLFSRLQALGYTVEDDRREAVYQQFVDLADHKKEVFEEDLHRLMETVREPTDAVRYRLDHVDVQVQTGQAPHARVRLLRRQNDAMQTFEAEASGDGPVDALYRAIDHAAGEPHELIDYAIRSVSKGADAQGEVHVQIRFGENHFEGRARSTDVVQASAVAYVDALNGLAAFRTDSASVQFVTDGIMQAFG